ncbi:MAG: flagellar hook capping FlgD N-terminal domain-containing protein [Pseudomonadota bacterium]|nr:flagellar hook capping FlgD N-terminal domain-containing protein [Pseudomonadota bacterium]
MTISYNVDNSYLVNQTNIKNGTENNGTARAAADLNFEDFLSLLVAQLENQDPLNPVENTEFTAQLAQFSQLEQTIQTNENLEALIADREYGQQTLAVSYIGRQVMTEGNTMRLQDGAPIDFQYYLPTNSANTVIEVFNSDGVLVKTIDADDQAGYHEVTWDGYGNEETRLPPGDYRIRVSAVEEDGDDIRASTFTYGTVQTVDTFGGNVALRFTDGRTADMSDVISVQNPVYVVPPEGNGDESGSDDQTS